jgi:hypothetical protein
MLRWRSLLLSLAWLMAMASAQSLTIVPADYDTPPALPGITAPGAPPPAEISSNAPALAAFNRGLDDVCAVAAALPAGPEKTQAEDACAYLRFTLDLKRIAVGLLVQKSRAATLPDWVVIDASGRLTGGGWSPRRTANNLMFWFPNWIIISPITLGPSGPFKQNADCGERFFRYNLLMHEAYRSQVQVWEIGNNCQLQTVQAVAFKRQMDRIDAALSRGGMPSAGSQVGACTFTPQDVELLGAMKDRLANQRWQACCEIAAKNCPPVPECAGIR